MIDEFLTGNDGGYRGNLYCRLTADSKWRNSESTADSRQTKPYKEAAPGLLAEENVKLQINYLRSMSLI